MSEQRPLDGDVTASRSISFRFIQDQELGAQLRGNLRPRCVRIIVDTVRRMLRGLGVVHANWKPCPAASRITSHCESELYQSLHPPGLGRAGSGGSADWTREMQRWRRSNRGHWTYKDGSAKEIKKRDVAVALLRRLIEWQPKS